MLASKALPGSPYDGHTLARRGDHRQRDPTIIADKGYRGHSAPAPYDMRVYVSEQRRGLTKQIARELKRRAAVEPIIGHMKASIAWTATT
ncbi:MAG: hypothetical protein J2P50_09510 [Hyphomicrobiaceae bacterium]|nr:hypothetical protein [Hyphomicrobiaceae bacterium]